MATYDVFTPDGIFERQVPVLCPEGDPTEDGIFLIDEDRVLIVKEYISAVATMYGSTGAEEDDAEAKQMELICYQIVR